MTPPEERKRIFAKQKVEAAWWREYPEMESKRAMVALVEAGEAVAVPEDGSAQEDMVRYKVSAKAHPGFRYLRNEAFGLLEEVARTWAARVQSNRGLRKGDCLVVTAMGRTVQYQEQLAKESPHPAVHRESTHTKLGAFDIDYGVFKEQFPAHYADLRAVLEELEAAGRLNLIDEETIEVFHVAANPQRDDSVT